MSTQEIYEQSDLLFRRGMYKEAAANLTREIDRNPNDPIAHIGRANARTRMNDIQGAVEDFNKAADIYRATGKLEKADQILERLQSFQRNNP